MPSKFTLKYLTVVLIAATMFMILFVCGCSSSSVTNEWRDPEYTGPPLTNMLIIAGKRNPTNRRLWEDAIVEGISGAGIRATASYRMFEDSIPTPDQVGSAVRASKFDGVLFIRRLPPEISTTYLEGAVRSEQVTKYNRRTQTYITFYRDVQDPGVTDTNRIERQEISVLLANDDGGRLIWSGTGQQINPTSREEVRQEISALIAPELIDEGIIPKKK
jgi:hypothetical protein